MSISRRRRTLKRIIIFIVVIVATVGFLFYTPFFTLQEIDLHNANNITKEDILRGGNIYIGESIFTLDTDVIQARLSQDIRIEKIVVRRHLPNKLEVLIKERRVLARIQCDYGYLELAQDGIVLEAYKDLQPMNIPMITGIIVDNLYIGDQVDNDVLKKILTFLQQCNEDNLDKISAINVGDENYIVMYTATDPPNQIRIGQMERIAEKVHLTESFLRDLENGLQNVEYVDFNYTTPTIKFAS